MTVSAVTNIGEGAQSLPATFWAVATPSAPTFTVQDTSRNSCTISWGAVTAPANSVINGYVLLFDDGKGGEFEVAYDGSTNPSKLEYIVEGLEK